MSLGHISDDKKNDFIHKIMDTYYALKINYQVRYFKRAVH